MALVGRDIHYLDFVCVKREYYIKKIKHYLKYENEVNQK